MNCNAPTSNPVDNISDVYQQCLRPKWGKYYPQISINKVLETDPIDAILLNLIIHGPLVNSYFAQVKTVKICILNDPTSCEF